MFQQVVFYSSLIILQVAFSVPIEEKIEPVDLYHNCIEPEKDENDLQKSPVILIHGLFGSHRDYVGTDQVIANRTKRKVCAFDLRNHGDSPWNNRFDVASMAADVGHFLDKNNIKTANLIGESLGGKVSIHYTLNNPDRVDSLIVEDMRPNTLTKFATKAIMVSLKILKKSVDAQPGGMNYSEAMQWATQYFKEGLHLLGHFSIPEDAAKLLDLVFVDGKWTVKHNLQLFSEVGRRNNFHEFWTESTGLYTGPTVFAYGTESIIHVEEDEENILKLFPNAKIVPIQGAGHLLHEFLPEVDDLIVNFLNDVN